MLKAFKRIVVESPSVTRMFNLNKFDKKLFTQGHLFVSPHFSMVNPLDKRELDIAYIGALSWEKPYLNS